VSDSANATTRRRHHFAILSDQTNPAVVRIEDSQNEKAIASAAFSERSRFVRSELESWNEILIATKNAMATPSCLLD
jgi:hypothetical protein